ncbi:MAG: hypothetical protein ACYCOR_20265 [Acidobacteriaceae bacterium]
MKRRNFLKLAAAAAVTPPWMLAQNRGGIDLRNCVVVLSPSAGDRESKAAQVLVEEAEKRCGIHWPIQKTKKEKAQVTIYLATRQSVGKLGRRSFAPGPELHGLQEEGFLLGSGQDSDGKWIAVLGADERGLLFGVGKLLRLIDFGRQEANISVHPLDIVSHPEYRLRGHQLGYRPKTNAYDAWSVELWDQYIRDLATFGINAIELIPPHSDDLPDSPHFPLLPNQMMVEMSRIADSYGMDVWVWYPAMDRDYSNPATVESALKEWGRTFAMLPRVDAVFVPGGDPGHTEPKYLLAFLEKQKKNLRQYHPQGQMWVSPQGFSSDWMQQFLEIVRQENTKQWLDGIVFGPMSRLPEAELLQALPKSYPIRCYPDITHSVECQYPVPDWDMAFALTEGREVINPRPQGEANILRRILPGTVGFITYSEGCNDDVNKFVWSALGWDSRQQVADVLRDFAHYFLGTQETQGFAQGLLHLESNWQGPLATNSGVEITLERFQDMERSCSPVVLENWRFQQALYRSYFDAFVRRRLLDETAHVEQARSELATMLEIGWGAVPLHIGAALATMPPNGLNPGPLLARAQAILEETIIRPAAGELRARVEELGAMLFQSIRMQLAVELYQGEAVNRAANLDTLDTPVSDTMWMRRRILGIRTMTDPMAQIAAIHSLLFRTDPGPGGFYDQPGNVSNRPHLVPGPGSVKDPDFRQSALIGFNYPDTLQDKAPMAWKCWAETLYDTPLVLHYPRLDRQARYRLRVVYSGDASQIKLRLMANDVLEIHPYMLRSWPPAPQDFSIPSEATSSGELTLSWTRELGLGGNGRGCQVAEVWLIQVSATGTA